MTCAAFRRVATGEFGDDACGFLRPIETADGPFGPQARPSVLQQLLREHFQNSILGRHKAAPQPAEHGGIDGLFGVSGNRNHKSRFVHGDRFTDGAESRVDHQDIAFPQELGVIQ